MTDSTHKIAFKMFLNPGSEAEYQRRHDQLWPELASLLTTSGVSDYSIFLDAPSGVLFAVLRRAPGHTMDDLPEHPVMQKWWQHMKDLMRTHPDGSPLVEPLSCVFHLD